MLSILLMICALASTIYSAADSVTDASVLNMISAETFLEELHRRLNKFPAEQYPTVKGNPSKELIDVYIAGRTGGIEHLVVHDPFNQLMHEGRFNPTVFKRSTRTVGFYSIKGQVKVCIKHNPEAPGLEVACDLLSQVIREASNNKPTNNAIITSTLAFVMDDSVFSASKYIEGPDLKEVLQEKDKFRNLCFAEQQNRFLIVSSLLTNPEDLRPPNAVAVHNGKHCEIVDIDKERVFGKSYQVNEEETCTRTHSFAFCLEEMHKPLPKGYFSLPVYGFIWWLKAVKAEHDYQLRLAKYARRTESILGVPISEERLREIFTKMILLAECSHENKTPWHVLNKTCEELAAIYQRPATNNDAESLCRAILNTDRGRMADETPPSAGAIEEYLGDKALTCSVFDDVVSLGSFANALELLVKPDVSRDVFNWSTNLYTALSLQTMRYSRNHAQEDAETPTSQYMP